MQRSLNIKLKRLDFFSKKSDFGITKNYRGITLDAIATKFYNALLLNRIQPKSRKFCGKIRTAFKEIAPKPSRF